MSNLEEVFSALHDVILERFKAQRGGEVGNAFVAFEFGTPIPDDTFRLNEADTSLSPELAVEFMSHHANTIPVVQNMLFTRRSYSVDEQYGLLLAGATPASETGMELLGSVRRNASAEFEQTLGSMAGPERFHPIRATPINWYDTADQGNWSHIVINRADNPPAPAQPRPSVDPNLKQWRVAPEAVKPLLRASVTRQSLQQLEVSAAAQPEMAQPGAVRPRLRRSLRNAALRNEGQATMIRAMPAASIRNFAAISDRPIATQAAVQAVARRQLSIDDARVLTDVVVRPEESAALKLGSVLASNATLRFATAVSTEAKPQEVASDQFSIDVWMCFVTLRRPWLSDGLLSLRNWYLPGFEKGSFSLGAGTADAGQFSLLPTACILIRDLKINAQWSDDDHDAIEGSANLGGFNLFGSSFDKSKALLQVPGMQSIAWICEPMPVLPPADAPTQ